MTPVWGYSVSSQLHDGLVEPPVPLDRIQLSYYRPSFHVIGTSQQIADWLHSHHHTIVEYDMECHDYSSQTIQHERKKERELEHKRKHKVAFLQATEGLAFELYSWHSQRFSVFKPGKQQLVIRVRDKPIETTHKLRAQCYQANGVVIKDVIGQLLGKANDERNHNSSIAVKRSNLDYE